MVRTFSLVVILLAELSRGSVYAQDYSHLAPRPFVLSIGTVCNTEAALREQFKNPVRAAGGCGQVTRSVDAMLYFLTDFNEASGTGIVVRFETEAFGTKFGMINWKTRSKIQI